MVRRSWRTQLKASTSPQAVLSVVSQFLDEWSREERAALPPGAWPSRLVSKADLLAHAVHLGGLHAHFRGEARALPGLQEMLLFFTHAAVRITQLDALQAEAGPDTPPRAVKPVSGEET